MESTEKVECNDCGLELIVRPGKNPARILSGHKTWCQSETYQGDEYSSLLVNRLRMVKEKKRKSCDKATEIDDSVQRRPPVFWETHQYHAVTSSALHGDMRKSKERVLLGASGIDTRKQIDLVEKNGEAMEASCEDQSVHGDFGEGDCYSNEISESRCSSLIYDTDGRLTAASKLACQVDLCFSTLPSGSLAAEADSSYDMNSSGAYNEAIEYLQDIQAEFKLRTRAIKRLVAWVNKYFIPAGQRKFSLRKRKDRDLTREAAMHNQDKARLPAIAPQTGVIHYGKGLPGYPQGIEYTLIYCDPLSTIARRVVAILYRYGRLAFEIASTSSDLGTAQQAELLRKANRQIGDPDGLIIPLKICADGAHMRGNGLHHITPIMMSIIHRYSFEEHTYPELVTTVITHASGPMKSTNPSLHHGILDALFAPLRSIHKKEKVFTVSFRGNEIRCYPVLYKMAMDMPMVATCSLTKLSRPAQQSYPCQQCLTPGKSRAYFLPPANAIDYRIESRMLEMVLDSSKQAERQQYALRQIGQPVFVNACPFDTRGIFLLVAADGLHAFQGMWFRGIVNLGLYAFYRCKDMPADSDDDNLSQSPSVPSSDIINPRPAGVIENLVHESSGTDTEFDYFTSHASSTGELSDFPENSDQSCPSESEDFSDTAENNTAPPNCKRNIRTGAMAIGDIAKRVSTILSSQRGQALVTRADRLLNTLRTSKGADVIPIRHHNVLKQLTKIQEHKYSLGYLLSMMAIVGCDVSRQTMGNGLRKLWLEVACMCIRIYALLYQRRPTIEMLNEVSLLIQRVLVATEHLEQAIDFEWWPPKKHLLIHFPDMIRMFGRMRLFDTAEGENGISMVKRCYNTISNRDVFHNFQRPLLERVDAHSRAHILASLDTKSTCTMDGGNPKTSWTLRRAPIMTSVRFQSIRNDGFIQLNRELPTWPLDVFPIKHDEPRAAAIQSLESSLSRYITQKAGNSSNGVVDMYYHATATKVDPVIGNTTVCASNVRYGRPRHDFVSYTLRGTVHYGQIMSLASIYIDAKQEAVAFISVLQTDKHSDASQHTCRCVDLDEILIHGRIRRTDDGSRAVECVPLMDIQHRVTVFEDSCADWRPPSAASRNPLSRLWPHGEWYFIIRPDTFDGVEHYN